MDERWPELFLPAMQDLMAQADSKAKQGDEGASKMYLYEIIALSVFGDIILTLSQEGSLSWSYWSLPSPQHSSEAGTLGTTKESLSQRNEVLELLR